MQSAHPTRLPHFFAGIACLALGSSGPGPEQQSPSGPTLETIAWMSGHWREEGPKGIVEELWLPPRGGLMLGLNRSVKGERSRAQFEYLRLELDGHGVVYQASPGGAKPTPFRLVEADEHHAVFENPDHDFPKRIEYRLVDGKLVASIAGDRPGPSWTFERVAELAR